MLTEVKAYSSWPSAPELPLDDSGRAETDLIQIRNIDGLDPVKATVNTSLFGSTDGSTYVGSSIGSRNIVLTVHPNPDWDLWTYESLRRLLYQYFMPKRPLRLVFLSDDIVPVEISGIVEDTQINQFSKDPEMIVSVICPDPFFTSVEPIVVSGQSVRPGDGPWQIDYQGTVEAGFQIKVTTLGPPYASYIRIQDLTVNATVDPTSYLEMSSVPMQKYVQNVSIGSGVITNLLSKVQEGSKWPTLLPGWNEFRVITDQGHQDWELICYERFGGL